MTKTTKKKVEKEKPVTLDSMGKLLFAIKTTYPNDPSEPGLLLSRLKDGQIYGAIHRYHQKCGEGKQVTHSAKGATAADVLRALAKELLATREVYDQLREAFK